MRGGSLIVASAVPHRVGGGGGGVDRFEHPRLEEVIPNCFVAFYDTCSESSGKMYCPILAGEGGGVGWGGGEGEEDI